ncbi:MAG TPA: hypothetical protein VFS20_01500 [Longimicrobium sp.]|nr:hypothetical protein [Longimicrobium sp.]
MALDTTPTTVPVSTPIEPPREGTAMVADTVPFGNRFGFPFTREEYKRALRQIFPEDDADFQTRLIYEPDPEAIGIGIADFNLLLLAALSDAVAERVIAYRPKLRDAVLRVREDPEGFVAGIRGLPPSQ